MGNLQATEFADAVNTGSISLDAALGWHLQSNHYLPVPASMVGPCKAAIEAANEHDFDREIELPEGITYKDRASAPAWAIVESYHLSSFLDYEKE